MKVKLNKIMKMSSFLSKNIRQAGKIVDSIVFKTNKVIILGLIIFWSSLIMTFSLPQIDLNVIKYLVFLSAILLPLGWFVNAVSISRNRKNQLQEECRETISNNQEQDKIDKNELMFTREALEKEMNHES